MITGVQIVKRIVGNLAYHTQGRNENFEYTLRSREEYEEITNRHEDLFFRDWLAHDTVLTLPRDQVHFFPQAGYCDVCQKKVDFLLENIWGA